MKDDSIAKRFAVELHVFSHLLVADIFELCERAKVLNTALKQALYAKSDKHTTFEEAGPPFRSRRASTAFLFQNFNCHVKIYFLFVTELGSSPILHIVDYATPF